MLAFLAPVLLSGCDREMDQTPASDSIPTQGGQNIATEKDAVHNPAPDPSNIVVDEDLEPGQYLLDLSTGRVSLRSNRASRLAILDDLAWRAEFELEYGDVADRPVFVSETRISLAELLQVLLDDVDYTANYAARTDDTEFRLTRLIVGPAGKPAGSVGEGRPAEPAPEFSNVFPQPAAEIDLGSEPENMDLATRLQYGTIEDQIAALEELDLGPAGLNAAYQVYTQTSSAQVRVAVLEAIEAEDSYLARSMIVLSLQSFDPAEALYALSIVDAQDDYSLAPQVAAMQYHPDAGVRALAAEVLESITADYAETDDTVPLNFGSQIPNHIGRDIAADR